MDYINFLKQSQDRIETKIRLHTSRRIAKRKTHNFVRSKGFKVVDGSIRNRIKEHSKERFGSASFWPWLELYAEIRGEFISGWIPNDLYRVILLEKHNPSNASSISYYKSFDQVIFSGFSFESILYGINGIYFDSNHSKIDSFKAKKILHEFNDEVVLKPNLGRKGKNLNFIHSSKINLKKIDYESGFIIQPIFRQIGILNHLHPPSLNTLRVFTFMEKDGTVSQKFTCLKFGIDGIRVDNTSSGGGFCKVNIDGSCEANYFNDKGNKMGETHPNTGVKFSTLKIPKFQLIKEKCKTAHYQFPYVRFIGWDVAINESAQPILIEWNAVEPIMWLMEALYGPYWGYDKNHILF